MRQVPYKYRQQKNKWRPFRLPKSPIKRGIWLPSRECLCILAARDAGLLKQADNLLLVEHDREIYESMKATVETNKITKAHCFYGGLHLTDPQHIDFADLDFEGGITWPVAEWMANKLSVSLAPNATIVLTITTKYRGNRLIKEQEAVFRGPWGTKIRELYPCVGNTHSLIILALRRIFRKWDFGIVPDQDGGTIPTYMDTSHPMSIFKLTSFKPQTEEPFPPI